MTRVIVLIVCFLVTSCGSEPPSAIVPPSFSLSDYRLESSLEFEFEDSFSGWTHPGGEDFLSANEELTLKVDPHASYAFLDYDVSPGEKYHVTAVMLSGTRGRMGRMLVGIKPVDGKYYSGPFAENMVQESIVIPQGKTMTITLQVNSLVPTDFFRFDAVKITKLTSIER